VHDKDKSSRYPIWRIIVEIASGQLKEEIVGVKSKVKSLDRYRLRRKKKFENLQNINFEAKANYLLLKGMPTEFEVQAYLYMNLLRLGFNVRGEIYTKCGTCRFDLVIHDGEKPLRIIEVKKKGSKRKKNKKILDKQIDKYSIYGIPVDLVISFGQAEDYIKRIDASSTKSLPNNHTKNISTIKEKEKFTKLPTNRSGIVKNQDPVKTAFIDELVELMNMSK
jgi:hypothetical protein